MTTKNRTLSKPAQNHINPNDQNEEQLDGWEARYYQKNAKKWEEMTLLEKAKNHWSSYII